MRCFKWNYTDVDKKNYRANYIEIEGFKVLYYRVVIYVSHCIGKRVLNKVQIKVTLFLIDLLFCQDFFLSLTHTDIPHAIIKVFGLFRVPVEVD